MIRTLSDWGFERFKPQLENMLTRQHGLGAKLRAYFKARARVRATPGYRTGTLDRARLPAARMGRTDVFRQTGDAQAVNAAVSILVDCSGSMYEENLLRAWTAALLTAEALDGIRVAVEIVGFSEVSGCTSANPYLVHGRTKRYDERYNEARVIERFRNDVFPYVSNNADGENLAIAYHDILQRHEPKKVIIIMSDGAPAACGVSSNSAPSGVTPVCDYTRKMIATIDADPRVTLMALGFDGFRNEYVGYANSQVIDDTSKLSDYLLDMVKHAM